MINPRIRELKINNYIKKIKELLVNFSEIDVTHSSNISISNKEFITTFYYHSNVFVTEFPIFDQVKNKYFESTEKIEREAFEMLRQNLSIFERFQKVKFTYDLNEETFIIGCLSSEINKILLFLPEITSPFTIYNEEETAILAVDRLEYHIEFSSLVFD